MLLIHKPSFMKSIALALVLLIATGYLVNAQEMTAKKSPVMLETLSPKDFNTTVESLSNAIIAKGWKVTITHDLQETMKKNGKTVLPVKVIELCNPALAYQILSKDEQRDVTPMLPCRISVYEKSDGKTYVSRMNAPAFASMIGGDAASTIERAFADAEMIIQSVIN